MTSSINLIVHSAEEFRAALPESGLFDMYDCAMQMEVPTDAPVQEIEEMTKTLQSFIHVTDVEVIPVPDSLGQYYISIVETPFSKRKPKS
jgi:hypothetical protein